MARLIDLRNLWRCVIPALESELIRGVKAPGAGFQPFIASGQPPKVGGRFAEGAKPHRALPQLEATTGRLPLRDLQREIGAFRLEINALGLARGVILEQNIKGPHVEYLG
ncbi:MULTISPECIES: hypothetical protein [unclassified Sphingopyxis]|uniref:hypothetical protein n=1 Tax=unclassified Sphingopyxis TaxID=2614943 RepID=UPI0013923C80|nr:MULTISPECIES: hypothetical protein [unclassified Sphingopyxis]